MTRRPAATGEVKPANTYTAKLVTSSVNDLCCIYECMKVSSMDACVCVPCHYTVYLPGEDHAPGFFIRTTRAAKIYFLSTAEGVAPTSSRAGSRDRNPPRVPLGTRKV